MSTPTDEQFFSSTDPSKPDIGFLKNHFYREGRVTEEQALFIINKGTEILKSEPNLLDVDAPITGTCRITPQFPVDSDFSLW
jgi:serine/threonine-protein phosphatase 2B catalytic subunit